jgi:hypothetical protein
MKPVVWNTSNVNRVVPVGSKIVILQVNEKGKGKARISNGN